MSFDEALGVLPPGGIGMVPVLPLLADNLSGELCHGDTIMKVSAGMTAYLFLIFVLSPDFVTELFGGM